MRVSIVLFGVLFLIIAGISVNSGETSKTGDKFWRDMMIRLAYVVIPKEPANGLMEVELEVYATDQEMPEMFEIGEKSWGYDGSDDPVASFDASDASGNALATTKLDAHHWQVETGSADSLRLRYTVHIGHRDSFMKASRALILGRQVFIVPKGIDSADITVQFKLPPGWEAITPWQREDDRYILGNTGHLTRAFLALGDYAIGQISVDRAQITIAASTELQCTPSRLADFIRDVLLEQAKVFNAEIEEDKLFIFTRGDRGAGGTLGWRSLSLSLMSKYTDEMLSAPRGRSEILPAWVISHEIFHTWPMGYLEGPQPFWFTEGFTDFYAYLTLCRMELLSQAGFHEHLSQENEKLMSEEMAQKVSLDEAGKSAFKEKWAGKINVTKGKLFAFLLDVEIRRRTDGKKSLDEFMRRMFEEFGKGEHTYRYEDMVRLLGDSTGQDMSSFFDDYVYGTKTIDLEDLITTALRVCPRYETGLHK
jgi:predicted metalloprotease with PDZ domain